MTSSIATLHVAKKQLGLDDDTYREKLARITGKRSAKDMTEDERQAVLKVFRNDGFTPAATARRANGRQKLTGKFAKKLQALWIAAWNLGIIRERDDAAMLAFVKRQTGIDHTRFLVYADDGRRAIEALKGWMNREAGVAWHRDSYDWMAAEGAKIAWAQWRILTPSASPMSRKGFDEFVIASAGVALLAAMTPSQWQRPMNELGERVRQQKTGAA